MSKITPDCIQCRERPAVDAFGWCALCADAYGTEPEPSNHPLWPPSTLTPAEVLTWILTGRATRVSAQGQLPAQGHDPAPVSDPSELPPF